MKKITYQFRLDNGDVVEKAVLCEEKLLETNLAAAREEAVDGVCTVTDVAEEPRPLDRLDTLEAQVSYTAMMTGTEIGG